MCKSGAMAHAHFKYLAGQGERPYAASRMWSRGVYFMQARCPAAQGRGYGDSNLAASSNTSCQCMAC